MTSFLASKGDEIIIWHLVRLPGSAVRRLLILWYQLKLHCEPSLWFFHHLSNAILLCSEIFVVSHRVISATFQQQALPLCYQLFLPVLHLS